MAHYLDRQTREEFNRFQENSVEENTNTAALVRRLLSDDYADKVIVTTERIISNDQVRRQPDRTSIRSVLYSKRR